MAVREVVAARAVLVPVVLLLASCARGPKTPEEAYERFAAAVTARDANALFDALDQQTRWSWMTVQRSHREARDILLSKFPDGPERTRELQRFEAGATSESAKAFFAKQVNDATWTRLAPGLSGTPTFTPGENETLVLTPAGRHLVFRKGDNKRWGFSGLSDEAEQIKRRAIADLEMLRTSATDYERAAARAGK